MIVKKNISKIDKQFSPLPKIIWLVESKSWAS